MDVLVKFLCENWLTIVSIIMSGLLSLWISAAYYRKGNRNNLQMTVVFSIVGLLDEAYSKDNYRSLVSLSKNYCNRYMNKEEKRVLSQLLLKYKDVIQYDTASMKTNILCAYFTYTLKNNGINPKPVPVVYDDEIVFYDYPPDWNYFCEDICRAFAEIEYECEPESLTNSIITLYNHYCREYYTKEPIAFFKDYTLNEVLSSSEIKKDWDKKFEEMKAVKEQFLTLQIAKGLLSK